MSMSRKDFERAAEILRTEREAAKQEYAPGLTGDQHKGTCLYTLTRVEDALCEWFRTENPRFDPGRFRRACQP